MATTKFLAKKLKGAPKKGEKKPEKKLNAALKKPGKIGKEAKSAKTLKGKK